MIKQPENQLINADEQWQKSIPAQVFLNHFRGIDYHIRHLVGSNKIGHLAGLRRFRPKQEAERLNLTRKWLLNAWNAEYTLRTTAANPDENFLKYALHSTFPQAYYSVLYSAKAFLSIQGINVNAEAIIRQIINGYVVKGWYPKSVSFYAEGPVGHYTLHHLLDSDEQALLLPIQTPKQAEAHVAQFLKTTRNLSARAFRQRLQANPEKALRTKKGKILTKFGVRNWEQIAKSMGVTTYFDIMARLKVSGSQRQLERFVEADIDISQFHHSLLNIVKYLNFVHECYVAKAVGIDQYSQWIDALPAYLRDGFVKQRLELNTRPLLDSLWPNRRLTT
ncbi:hypothetical protein [Runella aurantiaca]|uniref:Uncharacterized protein n=1 Tax=Runella aurantiaca TaxID=2282308 RepID=A0A369IHN0_9BACT|nr:hypothetical protein [Runella aurantiaca]RDB06893.1 hypothetical protein DVG78_06310 [Runella aurantiaca]